jgi:hypothetical protein
MTKRRKFFIQYGYRAKAFSLRFTPWIRIACGWVKIPPKTLYWPMHAHIRNLKKPKYFE